MPTRPAIGRGTVALSGAGTLAIHVQQERQALEVRATIDGTTHRYTVPEQRNLPTKMRAIYKALNPRPSLFALLEAVSGFFGDLFSDSEVKAIRRSDIQTLLVEAGQDLYAPILTSIKSASAIEFVLAEDCLSYPLDALYYRGRPLFLYKPITYRLHTHSDSLLQVSDQWKGLLISHESSDPERALLSVKRLFPRSVYFDDLEVHPKDLESVVAADFVLVSGHGDADDGIDLAHTAIRPDTFVQLAPQLVYFDSCELGLHRGFLHSLHRAGTLFYVAPILSNESGESSTKTIERFFGALREGEPPGDALFAARKTLFDHYTDQGDDFRLAMVRAFPFRAYRLN